VLVSIGLFGCAKAKVTSGIVTTPSETSAPTASFTVAPPTATHTVAPTATNTMAPTSTQTFEPTSSNTPELPTATHTLVSEILPIAGRWRAEGVGVNWSMVFEITHENGKAFFRLLSSPIFRCGGMVFSQKSWNNVLPFVDGKFQQENFWSAQVISADRIEGIRSFPDCVPIKWVGNIYQPASPSITSIP